MADTIAAVATPRGSGGVAVIRISGEQARCIAGHVFSPLPKAPRRMGYGRFLANGQPIDDGLAVWFPSGGSFTGEEVVELNCHGGMVLTQRILMLVLEAGARMAGPGEFTRRAFLNGKMDMTQAEAVMDLIYARSDRAAKAAYRQAAGELGRQIDALQQQLTEYRARLEVTLDYPEEDLEEATSQWLIPRIRALADELTRLMGRGRGRILREGVTVALAGAPNAGKSSLLNALVGEERAIVTEIAGTTRDALREQILLEGIPFTLTDTAGIRQARDKVEQLGVARSLAEAEKADILLVICDVSAPRPRLELPECRGTVITVASKSDLAPAWQDENALAVSARTGEGIEALKDKLVQLAGGGTLSEDLMTNARHLEAAGKALAALNRSLQAMEMGMTLDCAAVDLTDAWQALGEITGRTLNEHVIDHIFEHFCVGK